MRMLNKKTIAIMLSLIIMIGGVMFYSYKNVIFQRGNPIPYLLASLEINEETPYVEVGENTGVYIAPQGECQPLFEFIEETQNVDLVEQLGSGYRFENETKRLTISSEIYLRYFTVWTVPQNTLQTK